MKELRKKAPTPPFNWIKWEGNSEADRLSRRVYEEYCRENGFEISDRSNKGPVSDISLKKKGCKTLLE